MNRESQKQLLSPHAETCAGNRTSGTSPDAEQRILVDVWTDFICPWCGIGEIRFARALSEFEHRDRVQLVRHSFRLMPGQMPQPVEDLMAAKYELLPEEIATTLRNLEETAATVGLSYKLSGSIAGDTMDAHRLLHLAQTSGLGDGFQARVFKAAMFEGVSIYDHTALLDLALACGLDKSNACAVLRGTQFRDAVEEEEAVMKEHGGHSVPFFVFNNSRHYTGALSPDIFLDALNKTWRATEVEEPPLPPEGAVCGPDGCLLPS